MKLIHVFIFRHKTPHKLLVNAMRLLAFFLSFSFEKSTILNSTAHTHTTTQQQQQQKETRKFLRSCCCCPIHTLTASLERTRTERRTTYIFKSYIYYFNCLTTIHMKISINFCLTVHQQCQQQ